MKFTTPCFVRVEDERYELISWLEDVGYDCSTARVDVGYYGKTEPVFVVANDDDCRIQHNRPMSIHEYDCGTDIELFKALAAMNNENDRWQWFTGELNKESIWWKCNQSDKRERYMKGCLLHKATAEEVIEHFKNRK